MAPLLCAECGAPLVRDVFSDVSGFLVGTVCHECHTVTPESRPFEEQNHAFQALWQRQELTSLS